MKNTESVKEQPLKAQSPKAQALVQTGKAKAPAATGALADKPKAKKEPAAKAQKDEEPADRLPTTVEELKATKGGLVTFLFLSGKEKDVIAQELQTTFKLADAQAVKIVNRITGRARFFRRAFELLGFYREFRG